MSSEKVRLKILELEETRASLIPLSEFEDENNARKFYSKKSLTDKSSQYGVTPMDVATCLHTISDEILLYVEDLKTLDYKKVSPIQDNRRPLEIGVSSKYVGELNGLTKNGDSLLLGDLISADITKIMGGIESIKFESYPFIYDAEGVSIAINTTLLRLNPFSGAIDRYFSSSGAMEVNFSGNDISPFDVFILGISIPDNINPNSGYNVNTSFKITKNLTTGVDEVVNGTIGDKKIGIQNIELDQDNPHGLSIFSILGNRGMQIRVEDSATNAYAVDIGNDKFISSNSYNNNILRKISIIGKDLILTEHNISMWTLNGVSMSYNNDQYNTYIDNKGITDSVIFKNIVPISETIKKALDEL